MRIAIIGGSDYLEEELEDFLYKLHAKYPDAIIVTGTAVGRNIYEEVPGRKTKKLVRKIPSAERAAESLLSGLGHTIEIPKLQGATLAWLSGTKLSLASLEVSMAIEGTFELFRNSKGKLDHRMTSPRADVIVIVGKPDSSRAKQTADIWKRMDAWRDPKNRRPFHNVATPAAVEKDKKRKATKKTDRDLVAA